VNSARHTRLLGVLADETARTILSCVADGPQSAKELRVACEASQKTIYRRLDRLQDHDLVIEQQRLDPDGHHYSVYSASLERVVIELEDGDVSVDVFLREDPADQFTKLFEELR